MLKISLGMLIFSSIIMGVVKNLRKIFSKNKKLFFVYLLVVVLTFSLIALLSSPKVFNDTPLNSFIGIQFFMLLLGVLHLLLMRRYFPDLSEKESENFNELLFTLFMLVVGFIAYLNVVNHFRPFLSYVFLGAGIFFLIPLLFEKLYVYAFSVPVPIYKKWKYPLGANIKDPIAKELTNPSVISFEFRKNQNNKEVTNFRVKAPENMEFGKLFYFFINDYNEKHPESPIDFLDEIAQQPLEWTFYLKPKFLRFPKHLDYAKTVFENKIQENDIIVCQRM